MKKLLAFFSVAALLSACAPAEAPATPTAEAAAPAATVADIEAAHMAYVDAINTNDVEKVLAVLTDDIVYQAPNGPEVIGKPAVREWIAGYFGAFTTRWEKTSLEIVVAGEWAFERYGYKSTDTPKDGTPAINDEGKGINIYHHDADGIWRVARDGWSTNLPLATN